MNRRSMRTFLSQLTLALPLAALTACASTGSPPSPASPATAMRTTSLHCYSATEVARIESMREDSRTVAEVTQAVGGTPTDVLEVEQRLRDSRRTHRPVSAASDVGCAQVTLAQ
jgi:hypothetical protein